MPALTPEKLNEHTKEPWSLGNMNVAKPSKYQVWAAEPRCVDGSGESLAALQLIAHCNANGEMVPGVDEANAARIVNCVNALAGIENPEQWVREARDALEELVEGATESAVADGNDCWCHLDDGQCAICFAGDVLRKANNG